MIEKVKSHDQRKGQWLVNKIMEKRPGLLNAEQIYSIIWNMSSEEFNKIMEEYDK